MARNALSVLLVGALVNFRRSTWTLVAQPLAFDDDRFIDAFVAIAATHFHAATE